MYIDANVLALLEQRQGQHVLCNALTCTTSTQGLRASSIDARVGNASTAQRLAGRVSDAGRDRVALSCCMSASDSVRSRCFTSFLCACFSAAEAIGGREPWDTVVALLN